MRLVMDSVKALRVADNKEQIREFVRPYTIIDDEADNRLLLVDSLKKVYWLSEGDWLTRPEEAPAHGVVDMRDGRSNEGFRPFNINIMHFSQVKEMFRIELDQTDSAPCSVCHKPTFEHTVLIGSAIGDGLEYACPPDPSNEIDTEFSKLDEEKAIEKAEQRSAGRDFKKEVLARVGVNLVDEKSLAEMDETIKILTPNDDEGEVEESTLDESTSALLDAQNSWRGR